MSVTGPIPLSGRFPSLDESGELVRRGFDPLCVGPRRLRAGNTNSKAFGEGAQDVRRRSRQNFNRSRWRGRFRWCTGTIQEDTNLWDHTQSATTLNDLVQVRMCSINHQKNASSARCRQRSGIHWREQAGIGGLIVAGSEGNRAIVSVRQLSHRINCLRLQGDRFRGFHAVAARLAAFPCRKDSMVQ